VFFVQTHADLVQLIESGEPISTADFAVAMLDCYYELPSQAPRALTTVERLANDVARLPELMAQEKRMVYRPLEVWEFEVDRLNLEHMQREKVAPFVYETYERLIREITAWKPQPNSWRTQHQEYMLEKLSLWERRYKQRTASEADAGFIGVSDYRAAQIDALRDLIEATTANIEFNQKQIAAEEANKQQQRQALAAELNGSTT
jgi:hypothetical protein